MVDVIKLIAVVLAVVPFLLGIFGWMVNERRHLASLQTREAAVADVLVTQLKSYPGAIPAGSGPAGLSAQLVVAEVVIASDYLKTFLAGWRNLFGGEVRSFQRMVDRARREATLRVVEQARAQGYNAVCNLRLSTADVGGAVVAGRRGMPMASILASGTAYLARPAAAAGMAGPGAAAAGKPAW